MYPSMIRERLTEREILDCLERALAALPEADQRNIEQVQKELGKIRGLGRLSALQLILAVDQAPALDKLNQTLQGG